MNERRAWRAAPSTLVLVWVFVAVAVTILPALAITVGARGGPVWVVVLLVTLAVAAVVYAWRFGLHPRLAVVGDDLVISNPVRTVRVPLAEVVALTPGDDGLVVSTDTATHQVWCVQTATAAVRGHHVGRADQVITELRTYLPSVPRPAGDQVWTAVVPGRPTEPDTEPDTEADTEAPAEPRTETAIEPDADGSDTGEPELLIHRATRSDAETLTGLERKASQTALSHVFAPDQHPYPTEEVHQRWVALLGDRSTKVRVAELDDEAVGYLAWSGDRILHLGIDPAVQRHGHGRRLLDYAVTEIRRSHTHVRLWVLRDNVAARDFYRDHGFAETQAERECEFPPQPVEIEMVLPPAG